MARWQTAVLLAWVLATAAACAGQPPPADRPSREVEATAAERMVGVRLGELLWVTPDAGAPGSEHRFALLVGGSDDGGRLGFVESNLRLVRDALEETCHVPAASVRELGGPELRPDMVHDTLLSFAEAATSSEALVFVYLTGLASVDEQGAVHYLASDARRKLDGRWEGTFTRAELGAWLGEAAEKAAEVGCRLRPVVVVDVARPPYSAPSPGVSLAPLGAWELQAHQHARASGAPGSPGPTPFTRAFVASLTDLAIEGRAAPVELVFERTRGAVLAATAGSQVPELVVPTAAGPPPHLVAQRRVACSVTVLDAVDGQPLGPARVTLDGRGSVEGAGWLALAPLPGRHILRVSAPGYLTRVEELDVGVEHTGRALQVRLLPSLVQVQGWLSPPRDAVVSVDVAPESFDEAGVRPGYHVLETRPAPDGSFELRLPQLDEGRDLVVREGGDVVLRRRLPASPDRFLSAAGDVVEGLGLVDFGPVRMPDGHPLAGLREVELELLRAGGPGALPVPSNYENPKSLAEPAWLSEADVERWKLFGALSERQDWLPALAQLEALSERMDDEVYDAWRGWVELQHAEELADVSRISNRLAALPPERDTMRRALASRVLSAHLLRAGARATTAEPVAVDVLEAMPLELLEGSGRYAELLSTTVESRRLGVAATLLLRLCEAERWQDVLDVVASLGNRGTWGSLAFADLRSEALAMALEGELDLALAAGLGSEDWERADRVLGWMTAQGGRLGLTGTPVMLALAERIAVEHVPTEVRQLFGLAQQAFLAGDLPLADKRYERLGERMRGRYADFVDTQRAHLRPQLFVRHLKEGEELELEGRVEEAAAAYARALEYDRRAAAELLRLGVDTPGVIIVNSDGDAQHTEIGPVLAGSEPDVVVIVGPGSYAESLTVADSRSLVGVGGEVVVVAPSGSALSVPAGSTVAVSGLLLRTEGAGSPTVRVDDGQLVLESCRILPSAGAPAVAVGGPAARAELRRCEVPVADGDGFFVSTDAHLELTGCTVGLPGSGEGELRRFVVAESPRRVRVTDTVFGRFGISGPKRLSAMELARIQRANTIHVAEPSTWPAWAIDQLTHCSSIGEALEVADAGATIRVAPGLYEEQLEPRKSVRIEAADRTAGEVVVDGGQGEFVLRLDADASVVVVGVTFRLHKPDVEQPSETVSVVRGQLDLADCRLEAFDSTDAWVPEGLAIGYAVVQEELESAVSVVLRRCRISSDAVGITVRGRHHVSVWDSDIVGRVSGVLPLRGGQAELVATTIRGCQQGVSLGGPEANVRLEACTLSGNQEPFAFTEGADANQLSLAGTSVR